MRRRAPLPFRRRRPRVPYFRRRTPRRDVELLIGERVRWRAHLRAVFADLSGWMREPAS